MACIHRAIPSLFRQAAACLTGVSWALARDRCGSLSVEAAIIFSLILIPLMLGVWEGSRLILLRGTLDDAVQSASYFVAQAGSNTPTSAAVTSAARQAVGLPDLAVAVADVCVCSDQNGSSITTRACTASCTGGKIASQHLQITVDRSITAAFPYPFVPQTFALSASATVRKP